MENHSVGSQRAAADAGIDLLAQRALRGAAPPSSTGLRHSFVVSVLREAIVEGELKSGERLSEGEIARRLGVSRTPIREALGILERERLVTIVPRLGAFVRTVTEADVDEIYVVREALDVLATRLVVEHITPVGLAQLEETVAGMRTSVERGDHRAYVDGLDLFYELLMRLSGNATLELLHQSLLGPVRRLRRISMSHDGRMQTSFDQVEKIAAAIERHDPAAADLMREQIARARFTVKEVARHMLA